MGTIIESDKGVISNLLPIRKEDLSMFRDWWDLATCTEKAGSGLYQLTVTVKARNSFAESSDQVMNVAIHTLDSTGSPAVLNYPLTQAHFYDASHAFRTGAFEVELGRIEVRQSFGRVVYIRNADPGNPAWTDATLFSLAKIRDRDDTQQTLDAKIADIDVVISYVNNNNAQCLLDAVCLTSPRTFNMFHTDDAQPHPDRITAFDNALAMLRARYDAVLNDRLPTSSPIPNLLYIGAPEQGLHSAVWPTTAFGQQILGQQSATVTLHAAAGTSENPDVISAFNRRFASGYYGYPITLAHPRPVYPFIHPGDYHHSLNQYVNRGFVDQSRYFLLYANKRLQFGHQYSWLPYIENHTNMLHGNVPPYHDFDDLREPTAAELRHQCNMALAFGSDGLLFYQFVSCPNTNVGDRPFWPPDKTTWRNDSATGSPIDVDGNAGNLGFLDGDPITHVGLVERTCDWNGESKWDSTATYLHSFLQPVGDTIKQNLEWREAKVWSIRNMSGAGTNTTVSEVLSMRQDMPNPIDDADSTFVLVSEFEHKITHERYLFVANGRTHPIEGHRHITVKLSPSAGSEYQWKVTNVQTGDIWIVRPNATPDTTSTTNGFTDYFAPGSAALYRLEPFADETLDFNGECLAGSIFIEPAATLRTKYTDELYFHATKYICCHGEFWSDGTTFGPCDMEQQWFGIQVRDSGYASVENSMISGSFWGVVSGSDALAYITNSSFLTTGYALVNLGGTLSSFGSNAWNCDRSYAVSAGYSTRLSHDISNQSLMLTPYDIGVSHWGTGYTIMGDSRCTDFTVGIHCTFGTVFAGGYWNWGYWDRGYNRIEAKDVVLQTEAGGQIIFGDAAGSGSAMNCFILQNATTGAHAIDNGGGIFAPSNYWEPSPAIIIGNVDTTACLSSCPVPFAPTTNSLSKSMAASAPVARGAIRQALRDSNFVLLRRLLSNALASTNSVIDREDQDLLRLHILRIPGFEELRDTLVIHLLSVPDLRSKLVAAEVLAEAGRFREAYDITQSWSFAGSRELHTHALLCTALYAPLAIIGGYNVGLQAIQDIKNMVGNDSTLLDMFALYPMLYSRLNRPRRNSQIPKTHVATSILDRVIPSTIEIGCNYPNPFTTLTSFTFKLPVACEVRLTVHDMLGREVAVLREGPMDRGIHSAVLHAERLTAGMYLFRLQAGAEVRQGKMVLVR